MRRASVCSMTALQADGGALGGRWRAKKSRLRTIFAMRSPWATISSTGRRMGCGHLAGEQELAVADDDAQRVVQLVGHAGDELAQCGHLRGLDELGLGVAQAREAVLGGGVEPRVLEREGGLVGEGLKRLQLVGGELAAGVVAQASAPMTRSWAEQRDARPRPPGRVGDIFAHRRSAAPPRLSASMSVRRHDHLPHRRPRGPPRPRPAAAPRRAPAERPGPWAAISCRLPSSVVAADIAAPWTCQQVDDAAGDVARRCARPPACRPARGPRRPAPRPRRAGAAPRGRAARSGWPPRPGPRTSRRRRRYRR